MNKDRAQSEALIRKVEKLGARAIMFTVDTPWDSKRTLDERAKVQTAAKLRESAPLSTSQPSAAPLAVNQAISGYQDRNLTWKDIGFIKVINI